MKVIFDLNAIVLKPETVEDGFALGTIRGAWANLSEPLQSIIDCRPNEIHIKSEEVEVLRKDLHDLADLLYPQPSTLNLHERIKQLLGYEQTATFLHLQTFHSYAFKT